MFCVFLLLFSWKPIILCKKIYKTAAKEFALVDRGRAAAESLNPITTLNESTLCSKIETHRRQIKTRKRNLTRNHAQTDCCAAHLTVCVARRTRDGGKRVNSVGFSQAEKCVFMAQGHRLHVDFVRLCWFAHSRHTFNRFPSMPRLPRQLFPFTAFSRFRFQIFADFFNWRTNGENEIFHNDFPCSITVQTSVEATR